MNVLSIYRHMFAIPDLRRKILFTLAMFAVYRLGATIPVPGIDLEALRLFQAQQQVGGIYGLLNLFSGGALEQLSVFALGILPYITASIIMQLLAVVIPRLQALQEEGEAGRKVITQWTRYMTVVLALIQSTGFTFLFHVGTFTGGIDLIPNYTPGLVALIVLTMTAGTAFVMWLGELITQRGVGNGMSLLIFVSILSQFPFVFGQIWGQTAAVDLWFRFAVIMLIFLAMIVSIIYMDQAQRRIPIQFAKRVRGRRVMGGQSTYIPIKVNTAGVIPVIFATSVMLFPALIVTAIPSDGRIVQQIRTWVDVNLGRWRRRRTDLDLVRHRPVRPDRVLHLLLHRDPVRSREAIRDDPASGWFHPGGSSWAPDLGSPGSHPQPDHPSRVDLLGDHFGSACDCRVDLEHRHQLLRCVDSHRRGRGAGDDETDRESAHDAKL
jgi:preprotein translocase subunit SecY